MGFVRGVKEKYESFKAKPENQINIKMRNHRAAQLRELFSKPEKMDLETFNHEVWVLESKTILNGKPIEWDIDVSDPKILTLELFNQV
jgi:hypothetical protein